VRATAAVLRTNNAPFALEDVELSAPGPTEALVRLVSAGICRTDIEFASFMAPPVVLGHEGAGVVEAVGAAVQRLAPGDSVIMGFRSCGICRPCATAEPAYCERFDDLNFTGHRPDGTTAITAEGTGEAIAGHFLGQSSFASHVIVDERSAVRIPGVSEADLVPLGPFACGFQTGAGTVLNALQPSVGSSLAVFGAGAVGLAAVAAAAAAGCRPLIAVDVSEKRLALARQMGATDIVVSGPAVDPGPAISAVVGGGLDFAIDTTGLAPVLRSAIEALSTRGVAAMVGVGPSEELTIGWRTLLNGRTVTGIIGGASNPQVFVPQLLRLRADGRFPVDELIEYVPFAQINAAFDAVRAGEMIKAVLTF
jgi:aryl-alcohol dehydrogenase